MEEKNQKMPSILGKKVNLKPLLNNLEELVEEYFKIVNNNLVLRGLGGNKMSLEEVTLFLKECKENPKMLEYLIYERTTDKLMGDIYLKENTGDINLKNAEFGIMIDPDYHKKGYGKESIKLILRHGFEKLDYRLISLSVYKYNTNAINLYKNVGFKIINESIDKENGKEEWIMDIEKECIYNL